MERGVSTYQGLRELLADAYHAAALVEADMRNVTEALEAIRAKLSARHDIFSAWDEIDDQIGRAEMERLVPALLKLRERYEAEVTAAEIARLHDVFASRSEEEAYAVWLASCTQALLSWRLAMAKALCQESFSLLDAGREEVEFILAGIGYSLEERFGEAYPMYTRLGSHPLLSPVQRARFLCRAAQIQMYFYSNQAAARELVDQAAQLAPGEAEVMSVQGQYWLQVNDLDQARSFLNQTIQADPHFSEGYCYQGDSALKEEPPDLVAAGEWYQKAITAASGSIDGYLKLVDLYGRPELFPTRSERIPPLVERMFVIQPTDRAGSCARVARTYSQNGAFDDAHRWVERALEFDPDSVAAYLARGDIFLQLREYGKAIEAYEKVVSYAVDSPDGYLRIADVNEQQEEWDDAVSWFERGLQRRPEMSAYVRLRIGILRRTQGNHPEAEKELLSALEENPESEVTLSWLHDLADALTREGDSESALRVYGEIRRILQGEYSAEYHRKVALVHRKLEHWDDAFAAVEEAFAIDGQEAPWLAERSLIHNDQGHSLYSQARYRESAEAYRQAVRAERGDAVYHSNLAVALERVVTLEAEPDERVAVLDEAIASLEEAILLNPHSQQYRDRKRLLEAERRVGIRYGPRWLASTTVERPFAIEVAPDLVHLVSTDRASLTPELQEGVKSIRSWIEQEYGVVLPGINFLEDESLLPGEYRILFRDAPVRRGTLLVNRRLFPGDAQTLNALGIGWTQAANPFSGAPAYWVHEQDWEKLDQESQPLWKVLDYPLYELTAYGLQHLDLFLGHQETGDLMKRRDVSRHDTILNTSNALSELCAVLKGLVSERVSVVHLQEIADLLLEQLPAGANRTRIVELARLIPAVRERLPGNSAEFSFFTLGGTLAEAVERSVWRADREPALAIVPDLYMQAIDRIRNAVTTAPQPAVLLAPAALRPFIRKLVEQEFPQLWVLSEAELAEGLRANIVGEIDLEAPPAELPESRTPNLVQA